MRPDVGEVKLEHAASGSDGWLSWGKRWRRGHGVVIGIDLLVVLPAGGVNDEGGD